MLLLGSCLKRWIVGFEFLAKMPQPTTLTRLPRKIDLPVMRWTYGVAVYLGGRHWTHDGVYGVVHEAVGHAVLLDDVLAYWSEIKYDRLTNWLKLHLFVVKYLFMDVSRSPAILGIVPPPPLPLAA